jgi:hypothetical protein
MGLLAACRSSAYIAAAGALLFLIFFSLIFPLGTTSSKSHSRENPKQRLSGQDACEFISEKKEQ